MATAAQIIANQANALHSTGPKSAEGKAHASRNNLRHGLTLGVLAIEPEEQSAFCEFEAKFRAECKPEGAFECEALQQFLDAAWRLRKIRTLVRQLMEQHNEDPFVHPETEAQMTQLTRYRAAAEMVAFRAIRTLRELQTVRLARAFHVTKEEQTVIPPLVNPGTKIMLAGSMHAHNDRELYYDFYGAKRFTSAFPVEARCPAVATPNGSGGPCPNKAV